MKALIAALALSVPLSMAAAGQAQARGCIKGAIAGCAIGHHLAARHDAERKTQAQHAGH